MLIIRSHKTVIKLKSDSYSSIQSADSGALYLVKLTLHLYAAEVQSLIIPTRFLTLSFQLNVCYQFVNFYFKMSFLYTHCYSRFVSCGLTHVFEPFNHISERFLVNNPVLFPVICNESSKANK